LRAVLVSRARSREVSDGIVAEPVGTGAVDDRDVEPFLATGAVYCCWRV